MAPNWHGFPAQNWHEGCFCAVLGGFHPPTATTCCSGIGARPIRAELAGATRCEALGHVATGYAPVTMLARKLIRSGVDRDLPLEAWRDGTLALRFGSLARAAELTVHDDSRGLPRFVPYRPPRTARLHGRLSGPPGAEYA